MMGVRAREYKEDNMERACVEERVRDRERERERERESERERCLCRLRDPSTTLPLRYNSV